MADAFRTSCKVLKVDEALGLVFGWGLITDEHGVPYRDTDNERITQAEMLKAVTDFSVAAERPTDELHDAEPDGQVVFSFPLTDEVAAAFGIACDKRGWMIAARPSEEVLAKFKDGTYTGFSIGGQVDGWEPDEVAAA